MKKVLFRVILVLIALILILAGVELGARYLGYGDYTLPERDFTVYPDTTFFIPHKTYGYKMREGKFVINQDEQLLWTSTQDKEGYRICSLLPNSTKPEIWVFGCSFTYGWGVNDEQTYPWLLQVALPDYTVKNYGVGGYSTYQNLLQLEDLLDSVETKGLPKLVVLSYSFLHDQRNTASPFWMRAVSANVNLRELQYPFARLAGDSLSYQSLPIQYKGLPGHKKLNLISILEHEGNKEEDKSLHNREVTLRIIDKINKKCEENNIKLLLFGLDNSQDTYITLADIYKYVERPNIVVAPLDLNSKEYTYLPIDPHPNQEGHKLYAQVLGNWIKKLPK